MAIQSHNPPSKITASPIRTTLAATAVRPFVRDIDLKALELSQNRSVALFELLAISGFVVMMASVLFRLFLFINSGRDFVFRLRQLDPLIETHLVVAAVVGGLTWITSVVLLRVVADLVVKTIRPTPEISVPTFRDIAQINKQRNRAEDELFERNLKHRFLLQSFEWNDIRFFKNGVYRFAPRVNVLLGRNGFGKTLLLRTLVALLQRDDERSEQIFDAKSASITAQSKMDAGGRSLLTVGLLRNGNSEFIKRDITYFDDAFGKVPLLAIPDSRFVNRSVRTVSVSGTGSEPLARSGAKHFLSQEPYESVIQELLAQLCLEFVTKRSWGTPIGFDRPIFKLMEEVVRQLLEDDVFAFEAIRESGRNGFEILVRSSGNRNAPLAIQCASQGTLSVLAIFGLIYSFLRSLQSERSEDDVLQGSGIVLIDEVDAHLHPSWQQKILALLTSKFPNVQFIVSGHSPMIVAGCNSGEVSVLRRDREADLFYLDPLGEDFLGADPGELYQRVFEVDKSDRLYEEYSLKAMNRQALQSAIQTLTQKPRRTDQDEETLKHLLSESSLVERAIAARDKKLRAATSEAHLAKLEMENKKLKLALTEKDVENKGD